MYEYSGKHVNVDKKTGAILVNKKDLGLVQPGGNMSSRERTYLVAGSLAKVYHDQPSIQPSAEQDGTNLYFGGQRIMSLQYGDNGAEWAEKLNQAAGKGKQPVKQPVVSKGKGAVDLLPASIGH